MEYADISLAEDSTSLTSGPSGRGIYSYVDSQIKGANYIDAR